MQLDKTPRCPKCHYRDPGMVCPCCRTVIEETCEVCGKVTKTGQQTHPLGFVMIHKIDLKVCPNCESDLEKVLLAVVNDLRHMHKLEALEVEYGRIPRS